MTNVDVIDVVVSVVVAVVTVVVVVVVVVAVVVCNLPLPLLRIQDAGSTGLSNLR